MLNLPFIEESPHYPILPFEHWRIQLQFSILFFLILVSKGLLGIILLLVGKWRTDEPFSVQECSPHTSSSNSLLHHGILGSKISSYVVLLSIIRLASDMCQIHFRINKLLTQSVIDPQDYFLHAENFL